MDGNDEIQPRLPDCIKSERVVVVVVVVVFVVVVVVGCWLLVVVVMVVVFVVVMVVGCWLLVVVVTLVGQLGLGETNWHTATLVCCL